MSIRSRVSHDPQYSLKNGLCRAETICQSYKAPERGEEKCWGIITSDASV